MISITDLDIEARLELLNRVQEQCFCGTLPPSKSSPPTAETPDAPFQLLAIQKEFDASSDLISSQPDHIAIDWVGAIPTSVICELAMAFKVWNACPCNSLNQPNGFIQLNAPGE